MTGRVILWLMLLGILGGYGGAGQTGLNGFLARPVFGALPTSPKLHLEAPPARGEAPPARGEALSANALVVTDHRFGAKGDGTTDDTMAIQAAINAAGAGGTVVFPQPTHSYKLSAPLIISHPNLVITGWCTGWDNRYGGHLQQTNPGADIFTVKANGITIQNLSLQGTGQGHTGHGINLAFGTIQNRIFIKSVAISKVKDGIRKVGTEFYNSKFDEVSIGNCENGINLECSINSSNLIFMSVLSSSNRNAGIRLVGTDATLIGCNTGYNGKYGLFFYNCGDINLMQHYGESGTGVNAHFENIGNLFEIGCTYINPTYIQIGNHIQQGQYADQISAITKFPEGMYAGKGVTRPGRQGQLFFADYMQERELAQLSAKYQEWAGGAALSINEPIPALYGAGAAGGLLKAGRYLYAVSYVINGVETPLSDNRFGRVVGADGKVALSNIPISPGVGGSVSRKIYRTKNNQTWPFYLVGTISNNTDTTLEDNVPDSQLGETFAGQVRNAPDPTGRYLSVVTTGEATHQMTVRFPEAHKVLLRFNLYSKVGKNAVEVQFRKGETVVARGLLDGFHPYNRAYYYYQSGPYALGYGSSKNRWWEFQYLVDLHQKSIYLYQEGSPRGPVRGDNPTEEIDNVKFYFGKNTDCLIGDIELYRFDKVSHGSILTWNAGDTAPSVGAGRAFSQTPIFKTNNSAATALTTLKDGLTGQEVVIQFGDANTTLLDAAKGGAFKLSGGANFKPTPGSTIRLHWDGFHWVEQGRSLN